MKNKKGLKHKEYKTSGYKEVKKTEKEINYDKFM